MNFYKKTVLTASGIMLALTLSGCDLNPMNWANKAKNKFNETVNAPATSEEREAFLKGIPKPILPAAPACSNDPALLLCKTYPSVEALLADPNVKKFGFAISVNEQPVHKGEEPAVKYRLLKDGSVTRG